MIFLILQGQKKSAQVKCREALFIYFFNLRDESECNFNLMSLGLPQYTTGEHQLPQDSTEGTDEVSSSAKSCIWNNRRTLNYQ